MDKNEILEQAIKREGEKKRFTDVRYEKHMGRILIRTEQAGGHLISIEAAELLVDELLDAIHKGYYDLDTIAEKKKLK